MILRNSAMRNRETRVPACRRGPMASSPPFCRGKGVSLRERSSPAFWRLETLGQFDQGDPAIKGAFPISRCPWSGARFFVQTSHVPEMGCLVFLHGTGLIPGVGKSTIQRRVEHESDASPQGRCARVVLSGGGAGGLLRPRSCRGGARRAVRPGRVYVPQARRKLRVGTGSLLGLWRPREAQVRSAISFHSRPGGGADVHAPGPGLLRLRASGKGQ